MEPKKYQPKSEFFSRKFERTQDVEMRSRSSSPMKVDQPRSNHISHTFHIDHLTEEHKKSDSYEGSDSNKMSLRALRMIWSARVQRMRSMRTKASKKSNKIEAEGDHRKTKKLL